jgi:hypothetical protein
MCPKFLELYASLYDSFKFLDIALPKIFILMISIEVMGLQKN